MNALVLFDSEYGNTERLARAIARALPPTISVRLERSGQVSKLDSQGVDLVIVGGPTQRHKASASLKAVLESAPRGSLKGVKAAAFDTRYRMATWLSGSAAKRIAHRLRKLGAKLIVPAESFFMQRDLPPEAQKRRHELENLESGEVERAEKWAVAIAKEAGENYRLLKVPACKRSSDTSVSLS
jgi:flavodoxin